MRNLKVDSQNGNFLPVTIFYLKVLWYLILRNTNECKITKENNIQKLEKN